MGVFLSISLLHINFALAQEDFKSEKDLKKNADKIFESKDYIKAFPLFSQLLSIYPNDADYKYKFSVCMLYADKDREKALFYLKNAANNPNCDKMIFYYLGRGYHLNYRFREAVAAYQRFKELSNEKEIKPLLVDRQIEMCNNGMSLLKNKTDFSVLDKTEIKENEYFRSYDKDLLEIGRAHV